MKKILIAALWFPLTALAQSYPSPHFNNVTIDGTLTAATPTFTNPVPVTSGGTGAATASGARTNLSAAASGANSDITSLTGLTTPLSVAQGGSGLATIPQYNVLLGSGTGAVSAAAPSATAGLPLVSNGSAANPSFAAVSAAALPALTGDCTTSAGTVATTCATTNGSPIVPTVPTISTLKALSTTTAAALGRVYVAGYNAAGDDGGGFFDWNASSSTADNTCTIFQPSSLPTNGRWYREGYAKGRYSPVMCGAYTDGTHDDAAPIRSAMLALSVLTGGGTMQLNCNTTYNLASDAGNALRSIIYPYSNVNIVGCGPSSVLKVAAGMNTVSNGFFVIYPQDSTSAHPINNAQYRDFKIDDNGSNNNCSNSCYYNNIGIGATYGDGILVDGVTVVNNPGSQDFSFGNPSSSFPTIENVRIVNSRDENSCDLVNTACTDFSAIYLDVVNGVVANDTFYNSSQSAKNTAIELHGFNITATGNTVWNYNIGSNIAGQNDNASGIVLSGNSFINVYNGVRLYGSVGKYLTNISITGNSIALTDETVGPAIDLDRNVPSGTNAEEITISGNTFVSGQASGTTNIFGGVRLGPWVHQNVVGNTFRGFSGPAIYAGTTVGLTNSSIVSIADNTINNAGSTSTAASKVAIQMNNASNAASFSIHGNVIQSDTGYATTGIGGTGGAQVAGTVYGNTIGGAAITTAVNITGTNTKVGVTCSAGSPTASFTSYMGIQTHC